MTATIPVRFPILIAALAAGALAACGRGATDRAATASPAGLDTRAALPLTAAMAVHQKAEMRDHLRAVQEITGALAVDDFDAIATAASRLGWSAQQAAKCKHMGAGAPAFAALGEAFHHTADGIGAAAAQRDRAAVAAALGATLERCVGCHEAYRQDVVSDPAFAALGTGTTCPMAGHAE